jgi:hypothetical protein
VQWGSVTDGTNVYVALSDIGRIMLTYSQFTAADPKRAAACSRWLDTASASGTRAGRLRTRRAAARRSQPLSRIPVAFSDRSKATCVY